MPRKETNTSSITAQAQQDAVSDGIENFELPKSLITKIARSAIPDSAKLQKETILSLVKGSTVFINYLAATAHDVALSKQHKSISATDVLRALEVMELGDLVQNLQEELQVYRELSKTDKTKRATSSATPVLRTTPGVKLAVGSVSAPAPAVPTIKIKGKEKATTPFTSTPLGLAPSETTPSTSIPLELAPSESISTGPIAMDVDQEVAEEEEEEIVEEEEIIDEEEQDEDEEELQDTVALEDEELRKDSKGLDDSVGAVRPEVPKDDDKMIE